MVEIKPLKKFHLVYVDKMSIDMDVVEEPNKDALVIKTFEPGKTYKIGHVNNSLIYLPQKFYKKIGELKWIN